jgi:hypothetical protein
MSARQRHGSPTPPWSNVARTRAAPSTPSRRRTATIAADSPTERSVSELQHGAAHSDNPGPFRSPAWSEITRHRRHVLVCRGPRCTAYGANQVAEALTRRLTEHHLGDDHVLVTSTGCLFPLQPRTIRSWCTPTTPGTNTSTRTKPPASPTNTSTTAGLLTTRSLENRTKACFITRSEPLGDDGDGQDGLESDGQLVVAGGDATVAFESVDAVLDGVA